MYIYFYLMSMIKIVNKTNKDKLKKVNNTNTE